LSHVTETLILSTDFRIYKKYWSSWKPVQCDPSCSTRTDGQRARRDEITRFTQFFEKREKLPHITLSDWFL